MSTKRLERTVIEGGRSGWSKWERRQSHRDERSGERAWLGRVRADASAWEDAVQPRRRTVSKGFADKLGPAGRWLAKRVGKPWREIEGEILATFDTRTLAGRHIVHCHLFAPRWALPGMRRSWRLGCHHFFIDPGGVLRIEGRRPRWRRPSHVRGETEAWLAGRRIGVRGERAYWMDLASKDALADLARFRQGRELDPGELRRLRGFTEAERERFVIDLASPRAQERRPSRACSMLAAR